MSVLELGTPTHVPRRAIYRSASSPEQPRARYHIVDVNVEHVRLPEPAPQHLQMLIEFGQEEHGVWAHIAELDLSAEGPSLVDALRDVINAAQEWLEYLKEEQPELSPQLVDQARYVALLDAPMYSWFRAFRLAQ